MEKGNKQHRYYKYACIPSLLLMCLTMCRNMLVFIERFSSCGCYSWLDFQSSLLVHRRVLYGHWKWGSPAPSFGTGTLQVTHIMEWCLWRMLVVLLAPLLSLSTPEEVWEPPVLGREGAEGSQRGVVRNLLTRSTGDPSRACCELEAQRQNQHQNIQHL